MTPVTDPVHYLIEDAGRADGPERVVEGLVKALRQRGIPVWRFAVSVTTLHPEVFGSTLVWDEASGCRRNLIAHATVEEPGGEEYTPILQVMRENKALRVRLTDGTAVPWAAVRELQSRGATEYFLSALTLHNGARCFYSCATNQAGGFRDEDIARLEALRPALELRLDIIVQAETTQRLLEVYLGPNAARRVLEGRVRRGTGEQITAAIWYCDLRRFTTLTDQRSVHEVVQLLDQYFEAVADPIVEHGGEILKFIGDAVLAIFEVGPAGPADACQRALQAADRGLAGVRRRFPDGALQIGVALHFGELMYGNIGARDRLDFTVIGRAVNEVCRVEGLCKELGAPLLFTREFRNHLGEGAAIELTQATLRGVSKPASIFTTPEHASKP